MTRREMRLRTSSKQYIRLAVGIIATIALATSVACGGGDAAGSPTAVSGSATSGTPAGLSGSITVYAASSLTAAFYRESAAFQRANPAARVNFNFAGSPTLVTQLDQGAPADVLATADEKNMKTASDKKLMGADVKVFARNRLVIAVPKSNPGEVNATADLAKRGLKIVLAQKGVPVGDYARQSLTKMDADASRGGGFSDTVLRNVVSEEPNVKSVVSKIQLGEADAGIVYKTDITADVANDVTTIDIPDAFNIVASYPIAVTARAANRDVAAAFVAFVLSEAGQKILTDAGFIGAAS